MTRVYLGIGGNMGDTRSILRRALALIEVRGLGRVQAVSRLYSTEPVGYQDQPWFLNAAAAVDTERSPRDFLDGLRAIERELGRPDERVKNGPRPADLDILLWEDTIIDEEGLGVPHPAMHERSFVLEPLAEIAPDAMHPALNVTVEEMRSVLSDAAAAVALDEEDWP